MLIVFRNLLVVYIILFTIYSSYQLIPISISCILTINTGQLLVSSEHNKVIFDGVLNHNKLPLNFYREKIQYELLIIVLFFPSKNLLLPRFLQNCTLSVYLSEVTFILDLILSNVSRIYCYRGFVLLRCVLSAVFQPLQKGGQVIWTRGVWTIFWSWSSLILSTWALHSLCLFFLN